MTQYIDKTGLVAEITSLKVKYECGWNCAIDKVLEHIEDLEVKEVYLNEHQIADIIQNLFPTNQFIESETLLLEKEEAIIFAKHFFELGLKAQKGE